MPTNRQSYASRTKTRLLPGAKLGGRSQGSESADRRKTARSNGSALDLFGRH